MSDPGYLSNAQLAAKVSTLVDRWNTRENQMIALITQPDGTVTVTDGLGNNHELPSFPQLQLNVTALVDEASGAVAQVQTISSTVTAQAASAATSASNAAASASSAAAAIDAVEAAQAAAEAARDTANAAVSTANTAASNAADSATAAAGSATAASTSANSAHAAKGNAETARNTAQAAAAAANTSASNAAASAAQAQNIVDNAGNVVSVAGRSGAVVLDTSDIDGLQTALDGKAPANHGHHWDNITGKPHLQPTHDPQFTGYVHVFGAGYKIKTWDSQHGSLMIQNHLDVNRFELLWDKNTDEVTLTRYHSNGTSPQGRMMIKADGTFHFNNPIVAPRVTDKSRATRFFFNQL